MPVADHVHERHEDVESGLERLRVAAEVLDDIRALLRDDDRGLEEDDQAEEGEDERDNQRSVHR